jgi:putative transcriptional regulator
MIPRHHLPDELLMAHASGAAAPGLGVLVASHMVLCPDCRGRVAELEALGGAVLEQSPAAPLDPGLLDDIMDRLDQGPPPLQHTAPPSPGVGDHLLEGDLVLPGPIRALVAETAAKWSTIVPGVIHSLDLPLHIGQMPLRLIRMRGGFEVPKHTHQGTEINMVLAGGYSDDGADFERGDVQVSDADVTHSLRMHKDAPCVLLAVNEAPLIPVGTISKLAQIITGKM